MAETPMFFVPAATSENQESIYADFAKLCQSSVPKQEGRIYSITYVHDGEEWTATVGERLHGIQRKTSLSQGKKIERTIQLSDPATVLAIFPGTTFMVVTNHGISGNVGSAWENPFMAGNPKSVLYFAIA